MGADRAGDSASKAWWTAAWGQYPRGCECYFLCALDWLPMAGATKGPAAEEHGSSLLYAVGLGRHAGACSSRALCSSARARGAARSALRPRLSIAKLPKSRNMGLCARPAGLRCGQEGHRTQATHPGRYPWPSPECRCASRQPAGSRWRTIGSRSTNATPISIYRTDLRRRWLSGTEDRRRDHRDRQVETRNRQTRPTASLRRPPQALDRRTYLRLDLSTPTARARLRALRALGRCVHSPRNDPHHAPALNQASPLTVTQNFLDRLL